MAWFFESTGADVSFHISQHGTFHATGHGKQNFSAMTGDERDLKRLAKVTAGIWGIYPPVKDELIYDGLGRGLWSFFQGLQGEPGGMIQYFPAEGNETEMISGVAIFPEPAVTHAMDLLKLVDGRSDWRVLLTFEFGGFKETSAVSDNPTAAEFMSKKWGERRVHFAEGVSLTINPRG